MGANWVVSTVECCGWDSVLFGGRISDIAAVSIGKVPFESCDDESIALCKLTICNAEIGARIGRARDDDDDDESAAAETKCRFMGCCDKRCESWSCESWDEMRG